MRWLQRVKGIENLIMEVRENQNKLGEKHVPKWHAQTEI